MDTTLGDKDTSALQNVPMNFESTTRNILVLHFKSKLTATAIADIFSLKEEEVEQEIINFKALFSNREYLMNVIESLVAMNAKEKKKEHRRAEVASPDSYVSDLERRLTEAQIKAEAYEEMIRLAEARYGIRIKKKLGSK